VIVTNPGGLEARLSGGYTYEPPESFDINGDWVAHAGPEYENGYAIHHSEQHAYQRLVRHIRTFDVRACVIREEWRVFIFWRRRPRDLRHIGIARERGWHHQVPACPSGRWWADRSGVAAVSRYGYTGR
jgi:hypothetical protein